MDIYRANQVIGYVSVAVAAGTLYDHLITLDQEIELIWKRTRWTFVQASFLITRYLSDAVLIYSAITPTSNASLTRQDQCKHPENLIYWGSTLSFWVMQVIVIIRISVMYEHSHKIIFFLATCYALEVIPSTVIQVLSDPRKSGASSANLSGTSPCLPSASLWWANFFWLPILIWEIITFGLCLRKGLQYRASSSNPSGILPLPSKSQSLAYILLRDSIFFPLLGMTICLVNFIGGRYFTYTSKMIVILLCASSTPIIGCRFVLNLREAYYRPFRDECEQGRMTTILPIAFASSTRGPNCQTELDNTTIA